MSVALLGMHFGEDVVREVRSQLSARVEIVELDADGAPVEGSRRESSVGALLRDNPEDEALRRVLLMFNLRRRSAVIGGGASPSLRVTLLEAPRASEVAVTFALGERDLEALARAVGSQNKRATIDEARGWIRAQVAIALARVHEGGQ